KIRSRLDGPAWSLEEKEILPGEIHHRVKNNLQIIYSLLSIQAGYVKIKQYSDIFKDCQNRIMSIALAHEKLYQSNSLAHINLDEYINNLADTLFDSYGVIRGNISLIVDVENISLGIDTAILCGLILNELISNSLKHAFPNGQSGEIKILLHVLNGDEYQLIVSDNGIGIPEELDFRNTETFGLQMVNVLVEGKMRGSVELNISNGTEFHITFKEI
ncbi:MAG: sensor histidine kinase, partial [Calditrichia bacterium]